MFRKIEYSYERATLWVRYQLFPAIKNAVSDFFVTDKAPNLAAALAFFALMSFIPLLVLAVASLGYILEGSEAAYARVIQFVGQIAPHTVSDIMPLIKETISMKYAYGWVGILILVWIGSRVFEILEQALNRVWTLREDRPLLKRTGIALILVPGMVIFLGASLGLSAFYSISRNFEIPWMNVRLDEIPLLFALIGRLIPFIVSIAGFYLVYKIIAATHVYRKDAFIGALTAALLWEVLKRGYDWYVINIWEVNAIFGGLGTIAVFVLWVYLSCMVLLFGAEVAYNWQKVEETREDTYDYLDPDEQMSGL
ncbi:MAG TPA: YihY/virulence factor BrkB family protein [bacterium]|nr:YihY/virulence factor BrkB family protein [bacterium]